jgi:hypothetical protein
LFKLLQVQKAWEIFKLVIKYLPMIKIKGLHIQKLLHGCIIALTLLLNSISSEPTRILLFKLRTIITSVLSITNTMISNSPRILKREISLSPSLSQIPPLLFRIRSIKKGMDCILPLPKQLISTSLIMNTMDKQKTLLKWY